MAYNPWPLGRLPENWIRPEIAQLKQSGYVFDDPREINSIFEKKLAEFTGAKHAILVDCASNGIFLLLKYLRIEGVVQIPSHTYVSVPMQVIHAGAKPEFSDIHWSGEYELGSTGIVDSAARFKPDMFIGNGMHQVLSFQIKKRVPIGRGGAILTDDDNAAKWLRLARYDGRDLESPYDDENHVRQLGWHMYMTPEDAARGLILFDSLPGVYEDIANWNSYPDIRPWFKSIEQMKGTS